MQTFFFFLFHSLGVLFFYPLTLKCLSQAGKCYPLYDHSSVKHENAKTFYHEEPYTVTHYFIKWLLFISMFLRTFPAEHTFFFFFHFFVFIHSFVHSLFRRSTSVPTGGSNKKWKRRNWNERSESFENDAWWFCFSELPM